MCIRLPSSSRPCCSALSGSWGVGDGLSALRWRRLHVLLSREGATAAGLGLVQWPASRLGLERVEGNRGRVGSGRPKTFDVAASDDSPARVFERASGNFGWPAPGIRCFSIRCFRSGTLEALHSVISRITRQELPAANTPSGTARVTTLPAPNAAREPIRTPERLQLGWNRSRFHPN